MDIESTNLVNTYSSELYKMIFIYNTLINGWTVKMLDNNQFQFTNSNKEIRKKYLSKTFLRDFIDKNMNIEESLKT